jgi:NADH-ubiquinone oxidoreductase chain 2
MIIGGIGGLSQISLKKLLAYSGLANSGYMLYGIIANNQYTILAYIFNIYQYSITHINIFLIILFTILYIPNLQTPLEISKNNIKLNNNTISVNTKLDYLNINDLNRRSQFIYIYDLYNLITRNRSLTLCYIVSLTSFMGIPPLAGFYGKYYLLITGLLSGY